MKIWGIAGLVAALGSMPAAAAVGEATVAAKAASVQPQVVGWRRDIHANPELANREVRTAALVATELKRMGFEVRTGVAQTGVVGILRGAKPGKTIALRADMDALPVAEQTGLPFASKSTAMWNGQTVPVMHACGHDAHVAMLLGAAEVLAGLKSEIAGTVMVIFQPAEEGPPAGETGGAGRMLAEGVFDQLKPDAIFGIHVFPGPPGRIAFRGGGIMASSDTFRIELKGKQTHGAQPWNGIDLISLASEIVLGFNTTAARQTNVTESANVITIGAINGGVRHNIIAETLTMAGTLRTFDRARNTFLKQQIEAIVASRASTYGAQAKVTWEFSNPPTVNNPELTEQLAPVFKEAAGAAGVLANVTPTTTAEDFSKFQERIPGVFVFLGVSPPGIDYAKAAPNHSPFFDVYEPAMETGVRTHVLAALRYLGS